MELYRSHVLVCGGTGCSSSGSAKLIERFEEQLKEKGLDKEVKVVRTGCFGLCEAGPVVIVYPEGTFYSRVKVEDVDEIVSEHLLKGPQGSAPGLCGPQNPREQRSEEPQRDRLLQAAGARRAAELRRDRSREY